MNVVSGAIIHPHQSRRHRGKILVTFKNVLPTTSPCLNHLFQLTLIINSCRSKIAHSVERADRIAATKLISLFQRGLFPLINI